MPMGFEADALRLRRAIRDLVTVSAVPAVWAGREPRAIARTNEIGGAPGRRPAGAASDQDVAGVLRRGNRRPRTEATHDRGPRQRPWHSAGVTNLTAAGESLHAPVCAGVGKARTAAKPRQSDRELCRRSRDP